MEHEGLMHYAIAMKPVAFSLTPESLENVKEESVQKIPRFNIEGKINELNCSITEPVTGGFIIVPRVDVCMTRGFSLIGCSAL